MATAPICWMTTVPFPSGFDTVWMSQFLDCFSEEEVISILTRVAQSIGKDSKVYIMETLWDRQRYETASYCLTQISLYFTAMPTATVRCSIRMT